MASSHRFVVFGCAFAAFGCAWVSAQTQSAGAVDDVIGQEDEAEEALAPAAPSMSAGEVKFWEAMKLFRSKVPAEIAAGRAALEAAVAAEFTHAQVFLGECYQSGGYGYERNPKKAAATTRLAAERGNAYARVSYGLMLFSGIGVRRDDEKAFQWLNAALAEGADYSRPQPPADFFIGAEDAASESGVAGAAASDPVASAKARAHYILAVLLEKRKEGAAAQAHFVAAATAGVSGRDGVMQAALQAAVNFALGRGVPRDPVKANEMLEQSRKLGRHAGISLLHNYATAKLVDDFAVSEMEEAVAKASDEMEGEMQLNIARLLTDKKSKDYNPKEAVTWFELAAESGKPWAMLELAFLYSRGDLGKPEPEKAFAWFQRAVGDEKKKMKHYLGVANVVISLHHGIGTGKDVEKAREIAAKHRDDEIVSYLTTIDQCPTKVVTFEQWVELTKRWAKEKKDAQAQYFLGMRHEGGFGVRQHLKDAVSWYRKAVKAGHGAAARQLGVLYEAKGQHLGMDLAKRWNEAVACYRIGEAARDAKATAFLANMYLGGRGVMRNDEEAKRLLERSLQLDPELTLAMNNLGALYEARHRATKAEKQEILANLNLVEAQRRYEQADAKGDDYASHNLGRLHYEGLLGERNMQKAYGYFDKAAERGHTEARFRLGEMHEKGEGVPETPVEAAYHYRLAALDGHPKALERLVAFYLEGKGGAQDFERAQFWLARMIRNGDEMACARYADVALMREQDEEAVSMFKMLLRATNRTAQGLANDRLSRCYRDGVGVKANAARAKKYREKALELGCPDTIYAVALENIRDGKISEGIAALMRIAPISPGAAFRLGQMYYHGQNVEKDIAKAIGYLRDAAKTGHREALYFLAGTTFNRVEGAPELDEAISFAKAAEAGGLSKAAGLREKLELRKHAEQQAANERSS